MLKKRKVKKHFCERILVKGDKIWQKIKGYPVLNPDI
jgi:hypothetical protein